MHMNPVLQSDNAVALSMEQRMHGNLMEPVTLLARVPAGCDEAALRRAHAALLERLPAARLAFGEVAGFHGLRQVEGAAPQGSWRHLGDDPASQGTRPAAYAAWRADLAQALRAGRHAGLHAAWFGAGAGGWLAVGASPLVADGGSLHILAGLLLATARGGAAAPDAPFDYLNYVLWRQDIEADDTGAAQAYWAAHVRQAGAMPRLALRRDDAAAAGDEFLAVPVALEAPLRRAIDAIATRLSLSPEAVLHAAWLALLGRLAGDGPLVSGWQHDCRDDYDMLVGAIGAYEKCLPVHLAWDGERPFADWARAVADLRAAHRDVQEHWQAHGQGAQAAFGFSSRRVAAGASGVSVVEAPLPRGFELAMSVIGDATGQPLELWLGARAAVYDAAALQVLLAHCRDILLAVGADPMLPLARVLQPAEPEYLEGPALDVGTQSLYERIAQWARDTPQAPAVVDVEQGITLDYATLFGRVETLAAALWAEGVRAGGVVALHLPRGAALVAAMLAAWRCGAAYVPLDPAWPPARVDAILREVNATVVVAATGAATYPVPVLAPAAAATGTALPLFDAVSALAGEAYILYTSGSTGTPKGVVVGQRQLLNYAVAASAAMALARWRRWAMTATIAADLGNTAVYAALLHGAALVIAPEPVLHDAKAFARFVTAHGIDAVKMVPSHLAALLEDEASAVPACVVLGGEATSGALLQRLFALAPACEIHNHYGPTETTVGVLVHRVAGPDDTRGGVVPLSQPLANCRVCLLDGAGRPVPAGALGELYIGGAQVVAGYLGQPAHPAFVPDPLAPGRRGYRTGDLAYLLPGGRLRLAGRIDHQLKVRGFRVEPAEIEAALLAQPGIRQAVVLAHDAVQGTQLVAFVAAQVDPEAVGARRESLMRALGEALPQPMVPARIVFLPVLPRLANGKIDRLALAPLRDQAGGPLDPPRDVLETVIADSVAALLQRDRIGVHDDFFELGGHSLLVIKLVTRLRKQLRVEVEPGLVFDHPNVARLAEALRDQAVDPAALDEMAAARVQLAALAPQERAALVANLSESA